VDDRERLKGLVFPHPALVFKVVGKDLFVRVVATRSRPGPETPLKTAPYWNTDGPRGLVCPGSMRVPEISDVASMHEWMDSYFRSEFTHAASAVQLTSHPKGFLGLWRSLVGQKRFPVQLLTDTKETLQEFVTRGNERRGACHGNSPHPPGVARTAGPRAGRGLRRNGKCGCGRAAIPASINGGARPDLTFHQRGCWHRISGRRGFNCETTQRESLPWIGEIFSRGPGLRELRVE